MAELVSATVEKKLPLPLVKSVEIDIVDVTTPMIPKLNIVLSLQSIKMQTGAPFGVFVALINDARMLKSLKDTPGALRYEIMNEQSEATAGSLMIKRYVGVEDFISNGKIKRIVNKNKGTGVVIKEVSIEMDGFPPPDPKKRNQDLWLYCVAYETSNQDSPGRSGAPWGSTFKVGSPVVETIMMGGLPPANAYVYSVAGTGELYIGPVHRHKGRYMVGANHSEIPHPFLTRTKVSNQKIKDLRFLHNADRLNVDNFLLKGKSLPRKGVKNYERIKPLMGKNYFSEVHHSRDVRGKFKIFFSMDPFSFMNDHLRFANLFTNKASLRSCLTLDNITVHRRSTPFAPGAPPSKLVPRPIAGRNNMFEAPLQLVGTLKDRSITTIDVGNNDGLLNFVIYDPSMRVAEIGSFEYILDFEFIDHSGDALKKIIKQLRRDLDNFKPYILKFEGYGKKNFDHEKYLKDNTASIKADMSWKPLINDFLASILFIFGNEGFGGLAAGRWKGNLIAMVNPTSGTEKTLKLFVKLIEDHIAKLQRLIAPTPVGTSSRKFNVKSRMGPGPKADKKISYRHILSGILKKQESEVGFDYLGMRPKKGLSTISTDALAKRGQAESQKYTVSDSSADRINIFGYFSPHTVRTPDTVMVVAQKVQLLDGIPILNNNLNGSTKMFSQYDPDRKLFESQVVGVKKVLGAAGISLDPLKVELSEFIAMRTTAAETLDKDTKKIFSEGTFATDNQPAMDKLRGSSAPPRLSPALMKQQITLVRSAFSSEMVDGIARNHHRSAIAPRDSRDSNSFARTMAQSMPSEVLKQNSFAQALYFNSVARVERLQGYANGDPQRPIWTTLSQEQFDGLKASNTKALCRLKKCSPIVATPNRYELEPYDSLFIIGSGGGGAKPQSRLLKPSSTAVFTAAYKSIDALGGATSREMAPGPPDLGVEYSTSESMVFSSAGAASAGLPTSKAAGPMTRSSPSAGGRPSRGGTPRGSGGGSY